MSIFKEYISTIIYISIFIIILELIIPNSKTKKYITMLASLIVIITIISPVINIIKEDRLEDTLSQVIETISSSAVQMKNTKKYDFSDYQNKILLKSTRQSLEDDIENYIRNNMAEDIDLDSVDIDLNKDYTLGEVKIYIRKMKTENILKVSNLINSINENYSIPKDLIKIIEGGS